MSPDLILALAMLINFSLLGSGRIRLCIRAASVQGVLIALLPLLSGHLNWRGLALAGATLVVKGVLIPRFLIGALDKVKIRREVEPFIGFVTSLLLGAIGTAFALVVGRYLPLAPGQGIELAVPASLATIFTGLLVIITRRKAITQVVGYLVLENGVFIFGLPLVGAVPVLVEAGLLLDLVAGIFIMAIVLNHIQREFSSLDTHRLSTLKE